jgi:hypothetical protein
MVCTKNYSWYCQQKHRFFSFALPGMLNTYSSMLHVHVWYVPLTYDTTWQIYVNFNIPVWISRDFFYATFHITWTLLQDFASSNFIGQSKVHLEAKLNWIVTDVNAVFFCCRHYCSSFLKDWICEIYRLFFVVAVDMLSLCI